MPCFMPFNSSSLEISFFAFRPLGVFDDEVIDALKYFSYCTEDLGCAYSSVFKSIHGNMIIWYGAWIKRSNENRKLLTSSLVSVLTKVSSLALLLDYGFFDSYTGESKDGLPTAKFYSGDTISMNSMITNSDDLSDLSYACLALMKSSFLKMEGVSAGVCLKCHDKPRVVCATVWRSLHSCYSWLLNSNYRKTISPYIEHLMVDIKYDVFRVVYVRYDDLPNIQFLSTLKLLENGGQSGEDED